MFNYYHDFDYAGEAATTVSVANSSGNSIDMMEILIIAIAVITVATFILAVISFVKTNNIKKKVEAIGIKVGNMDAGKDSDIGVVFCKKCGSNYNVSEKKCPYCGEKR